MQEDTLSISFLKLSDFNIPTLAFLSFFTYQYLFPQYFFNFLYSLNIPTVSVGLCMIFAVIGLNHQNLKYIKKEIISFFIIGIMFFFARFFVTAPNPAKIMFNQHLHQVAIGLVFVCQFRSNRKLHLFILLLISYTSFSALIGIKEGGLIWGHDFLQDENQISSFMAMVLPVTYFYSNYTKDKRAKIICYIYMALMTTLIVLSYSRGGFLALLSVVLCIFLYAKKKVFYMILVIVGVVGIMTFAPPRFFYEINTLQQGAEEGTAGARVEYWRRALEMFKENPILGKGIHQFPTLSHEYILPGHIIDERNDYMVCHSNWFQILSELGIVGVICYSVLFVGYLKTWRMIVKCPREIIISHFGDEEYRFYKHLATGLGIGMIGYMVAGTFLNILTFPFLYLFFFLMLCVKVNWLTKLEIKNNELNNAV